MKKLARTDASIDYVKLLSDHAKAKGLGEYTEDVIKAFGDKVTEGVSESTQAGHRVRGLRAQSIFMCVAASIAKIASSRKRTAATCTTRAMI
jgi:hypothetical protein